MQKSNQKTTKPSKSTKNPETISILESQLKSLAQKPKTQTNTAKIKQLTQKIKHQKELNKLTTAKLEIGNLSHLIFFDSTGGYTKLTDNSAIIYAGNIAKRIGRRVNLRQDTDNYAKSTLGIVSVRLNEELIQKLAAIGIKPDKNLSTTHIHAFKLDKPIEETFLQTLQDNIKQDLERVNKIIMPHDPIPTLFIYLKELLEITYYNTKTMPDFARHLYGEEIATTANTMLKTYLQYADARIAKPEMAKILYNGAIKIKRQMKTAEILHLISNRNICRILERTIAIERLSNKYYKEQK